MTIPPELLSAANILPYEAVVVWNVTRGTRLETYAIEGLPGSNSICANGAAAHLIQPKDIVIIATYAFYPATDKGVDIKEPTVVFVDEENRLTEIGSEIPGPKVSHRE